MLTTTLASLIGHSYSSTAGSEWPADAVQTQFGGLTLPLTYIYFSTTYAIRQLTLIETQSPNQIAVE